MYMYLRPYNHICLFTICHTMVDPISRRRLGSLSERRLAQRRRSHLAPRGCRRRVGAASGGGDGGREGRHGGGGRWTRGRGMLGLIGNDVVLPG